MMTGKRITGTPGVRGIPRAGRRVSHEQAVIEIEAAGKRHAASAESARAFLRRIGILDSNDEIAAYYR